MNCQELKFTEMGVANEVPVMPSGTDHEIGRRP